MFLHKINTIIYFLPEDHPLLPVRGQIIYFLSEDHPLLPVRGPSSTSCQRTILYFLSEDKSSTSCQRTILYFLSLDHPLLPVIGPSSTSCQRTSCLRGTLRHQGVQCGGRLRVFSEVEGSGCSVRWKAQGVQ
ncbi:hypothetical protein JOQ06_012497 [Pogonophryne albipinna]|uniref:Uncharacterized protein n=1 Tax=Pogonophryne albipinna TaxID=1090488 RepID=A0AAD6F669_9TELE|nr:hypothetical protein JOQ06_012497 [Pogonophryne albipinna]